ncbi:hexosaminidase D [Erpetoichthys calabaricus]|uniref:hexosaminidase D n=1 Tax=Erpetoichthys calabaricus TaxID=27687 RepID=UPI002234EA43|nr:hexosaminidase D [Erpetoichthys calabaricus]XP_028675608.2 hexosaminidase D [Erpetoichthys calabaricus]XP_051792468.1 hexosaminidase D [Erpetoichthys calabaricus]XP_051792469.1 hexosaminidase D [Erpetoichthys calabaricus]
MEHSNKTAIQKAVKLVHLDLKGAPPRISYFAQVFPLFSQLGANGLLVEYEDMFPYEGRLQVLRANHAYSKAEIGELLELAKANELEVIPLVQTFGHMEFVLKHKEFCSLREVTTLSNALNPHKDEAMKLVQEMIDQMLALHPAARWLHIGADEVYCLGEGEESKVWLSHSQNHLSKLLLSHLAKVAKHVITTHPHVRPLIWDDMLRTMEVSFLAESGLGQIVDPMIWYYSPDLDVKETVNLIEKYQHGGFSRLWIASSYKGSTGANQCVTLITHHLDNHRQWLQVVQALPEGSVELQGIALTGWQRYDHFSVLCELLPVAIPSLAVCLQTVQHGDFTEEAEAAVRRVLGISDMEIDKYVREDLGTFPGCDIAKLVTQVSAYLKVTVDNFLEGNRFIGGWFSQYHRKHKFVHPLLVQHFEPEAHEMLAKWNSVAEELKEALARIYYPDAVEEWMEEHVNPSLGRIRDLVHDIAEAKGDQA